MSKVRYNKELLDSCIERDGATLVGEYEKLNRDSNIKFICSCGKEGEKGFGSVYRKGGLYCNECSTINKSKKIKQTNLEKYGVENIFQSEEIKDKTKQSNLEKYGVECYFQSNEFKDKTKQTNLEKYGVECYMQTNEFRDKTKQSNLEKYGVECYMQTNEFRDKTKQTNNKKYGVDNPNQNKEIQNKIKHTSIKKYGVKYPNQNKEIRDKIKHTNIIKYGVENYIETKDSKEKLRISLLENYGVEYPGQSDIIKERIKQTNIKNLGVENPFQSDIVKKKIEETNIKKYGVSNPMQHPEIAEKCLKSLYSTKDFNLPSGNTIRIQGYEHFALDKIIKEWDVEEDDIITDRTKVPEIWWNDSNNIKRRYYVDIFISSKNLVIEVKSTWTITLDVDNIKRKIQASKELGYNTLLWVFDEKGNVIKEYDNCPIEV